MKSLLLLTLLFCTTFYAQPSANIPIKEGSLSGIVIDEQLQQPLPYVTIIIKNDQKSTVTGGISKDDGTFKISKLPVGHYTATIQYIGYESINQDFQITEKQYDVNLGRIYLKEDVAALGEVTVVAEVSSIQQKVDRKVITVGKDLTTAGATASDIMNNIPSVSIDQQTGNLSLRGNENVRVMVDGKLSNVPVDQLLKQIPSASIKQIELITNPSAKYNPEGMSGIINIILHKNTNIGFNGNLNLGLTKDINANFTSSIDLNYRNGKFNVYGTYGNNIGKSNHYGTIERPNEDITQTLDIYNNRKAHLYKFGVDYYLDDANTISVLTNQNVFNGDGLGKINILQPALPIQGQIFDGVAKNTSSQYNLVFKHNFKKEGENLEFEADYNNFDEDDNTQYKYYNIDDRPNYSDFVDTNRQQTTINLDYVNPLSEAAKLEAGFEARLYSTDVNYDSTGQSFDVQGSIIPTPTTVFEYNRDIYAAYLTYGKTFEKWSYQIGARAEMASDNADARTFETNGDTHTTFNNDYFQLYPSAFLTYTPSEKNSYQVSLSRRVDRPGLRQINPIREWSSPLISSLGNPDLLPQFTNSIELNYTRKLDKGSITAGVFYRMIEDEINRAAFIDRLDLNKVILSYDNFDDTSAYGVELSSSYRPTKWWSLNASFDLFAQTQKGITESFAVLNGQTPTVNDIVLNEISIDNIAYSFRMSNNFKATKKLTFSLFGMYRSKSQSIQFNALPMYFINTGLRYNFLDDRATFSFNYNDVFKTMSARFEGDAPYAQKGEIHWESNSWNVGLSYRFGGGKFKSIQRKQRNQKDDSTGGGFL